MVYHVSVQVDRLRDTLEQTKQRVISRYGLVFFVVTSDIFLYRHDTTNTTIGYEVHSIGRC